MSKEYGPVCEGSICDFSFLSGFTCSKVGVIDLCRFYHQHWMNAGSWNGDHAGLPHDMLGFFLLPLKCGGIMTLSRSFSLACFEFVKQIWSSCVQQILQQEECRKGDLISVSTGVYAKHLCLSLLFVFNSFLHLQVWPKTCLNLCSFLGPASVLGLIYQPPPPHPSASLCVFFLCYWGEGGGCWKGYAWEPSPISWPNPYDGQVCFWT